MVLERRIMPLSLCNSSSSSLIKVDLPVPLPPIIPNLLNSEALANKRFDKKLAQEEVWIHQGIKARRTRNEGRVRSLQEMRSSFIYQSALDHLRQNPWLSYLGQGFHAFDQSRLT
jgi:hypothetical protein